MHRADVYVTDWHNARDVRSRRRIRFDDFIDYVRRLPREDGSRRAHRGGMPAAVAVLAAVALMAAAANPCLPRSMTLMAARSTRDQPHQAIAVGDRRRSNGSRPIDLRVLSVMPARPAGLSRLFCRSARSCRLLEPHIRALLPQFGNLIDDDEAPMTTPSRLYDEFLRSWICRRLLSTDGRADFQKYELARRLVSRGARSSRPDQAARAMTVEENDDICASAKRSRAGLSPAPPATQHHHLQTGVGHYGVFSAGAGDPKLSSLPRMIWVSN